MYSYIGINQTKSTVHCPKKVRQKRKQEREVQKREREGGEKESRLRVERFKFKLEEVVVKA